MIVIRYADDRIRKSFEKLKKRDEKLLRHLKNAVENIREDPVCGIKISRRLIPKEWVKRYGVNNLYKYNLPNAWRLIYSLSGNEAQLIAIVLGCFNHKEYERKFNY